eukprot:5560586-Pleurochrysis_carterae.AAC.3
MDWTERVSLRLTMLSRVHSRRPASGAAKRAHTHSKHNCHEDQPQCVDFSLRARTFLGIRSTAHARQKFTTAIDQQNASAF